MVRLVDEALRGPHFEQAKGLASPHVTIADPAVGTGTFLLGVMRKIAANVADDEGEGAVRAALLSAMKRLFGFELQFGPFAVAQLRVLAELRALTPTNTDDAALAQSLNLFITDTLGNPFVEDEHLPQIMEAVAKSRRDANRVKRGQPITVVIGNPPYKHHAGGLGSWIEEGSSNHEQPMKFWSPPPEWKLSAHTHHLKNLYIYFWRWATLKVFGSGWKAATGNSDADRHGVICFISASGFLVGPAFEKMRYELRRDASEIWIIDCSPEGYQPQVSTRIFEGVQQPICIVLALRTPGKDRELPARVRVLQLSAGHRKEKFTELNELSMLAPGWRDGPNGWREPFLAAARSYWTNFASLQSVFNWSGSGVTPHRTWPIAPDAQSLERRWATLRNGKDLNLKRLMFHEDSDRKVDKRVTVALGNCATRTETVAKDTAQIVPPVRYGFRSFDRQWLIPDHRLLSRARPRLWSALSPSQVFLTVPEASPSKSGPALTITGLIPDLDHYKGSFGGRVYPLWADAAATQPNLRVELLQLLATTYGLPVSAEDAFAYIAGVMAHPAFTARFAKDLVRPGLRLPLTADAKLFQQANTLGREIVWLHSYGERFADKAAGRPKGPPRLPKAQAPHMPAKGAIPPAPEPLPADMEYDANTQRLRIGAGFIDNVTPAMWAYEVSGKNVLRQWFSYRRLDRTKPIIGDRRPPSPLEKIQPEGWLSDYTTDLLDLLHVLGRLVALEPAQAALLDAICEGPLIPAAALREAGLIEDATAD